MIAAIFEDYVRFLDRHFDAKNRQVLLIIDNYLSHRKIGNLKAIAAEFLPANTTAVRQQMGQGIIETNRKLYHKALLQCMLRAYDASKRYNIDLLGAIRSLNF